MCTLILGRDILGPGTTLLAANRDEDPSRPSDPPHVLARAPRIVGGSDRRAGGTWLAIRETSVAVAMLNRRPVRDLPPPERSRGLLALEVAGVTPDAPDDASLSRAAEKTAFAAVAASRYAPFSLVFATRAEAWVLAWDGVPSVARVAAGWHVLTHAELDDPGEPRTARLLRDLAGWAPASFDEAATGLRTRLSFHDVPTVCIHDGRMATVSYAIVLLAGGRTRYLHADGRPCVVAPGDFSELMAGDATAT